LVDRLNELRPDTENSTPLYLQVASKLTVSIHSGLWQPNEALPSERVMSESLEISRFTARKAMDVLCQRGILTRRHGSGTYVNLTLPRPLSRLTNFSEELRQRGFTPGSHWISRETGIAAGEERRALGLPPNTPVSRLKRLRTADNVVLAIETSTILAQYMPDPKAVTDTLYGFLAQQSALPIRAINANAEQARLTNIEPGEAMLYIKRVGYLENGAAVELTHSYFRSDSYDFVAVLCQD
jgi:GntR family transcriptional regulator